MANDNANASDANTGRAVGDLSARGSALADPANKATLLDVVSDLYHPESNPNGYLSLGVAENTLMHDEIAEYITKNVSLDSHSLTYGDGFIGSHRLRDVIADFVTRRFGSVRPVRRSHVTVTGGVSPALEACAFTVCDPGDGILLGRPYYGSFAGDVGYRAQAKIVSVGFGDVDPFSIEALDAYERAVAESRENGVPVKALILCNPHNPLGRCYPRDVLEAYLRFCDRHRLHLFADEIYALSVWDNPDVPGAPGFDSILSIDLEGLVDPSLVHVLWGMSKDFCSNGIRLGCVISQSNPPFVRSLEPNGFFTCPSALADRAASAILSDGAFVDSLVATNRARLAANYDLTVRFLEGRGIPYAAGSNAGFFVWVDLFAPLMGAGSRLDGPPRRGAGDLGTGDLWALEARLHRALLARRVFLASGLAFGSEVPGWFRIVFGHERGYLGRGLERMAEAVERFRVEEGLGGSGPGVEIGGGDGDGAAGAGTKAKL